MYSSLGVRSGWSGRSMGCGGGSRQQAAGGRPHGVPRPCDPCDLHCQVAPGSRHATPPAQPPTVHAVLHVTGHAAACWRLLAGLRETKAQDQCLPCRSPGPSHLSVVCAHPLPSHRANCGRLCRLSSGAGQRRRAERRKAWIKYCEFTIRGNVGTCPLLVPGSGAVTSEHVRS